jgi:hypothetical protein
VINDYTLACASCPICNGSGYIGADLCECLLKHRIRIFMSYGGFSQSVINFVSNPEYRVPEIDAGEDILTQYLSDPERVINKGLSLYIFSHDAGRGKTVLSYYIVKQLCAYFALTQNYRPKMSFVFQTCDAMLDNALAFTDDELWQASVFVLDDIGNENRATKVRREAIAPSLQKILQYRRHEGLPTIFTSNYTPGTLSSLYEGRIDSLLEIGPDGVIHGNLFRQIEVGGGEDLRTLGSEWD